MEYRVHISQFEGPLDLLLHLIEKAELNIEDIFLSEITSQYLAYMEELSEEELDTASDFLLVAAQLVYLKSRRLLPRQEEKTVEEEEDPEEAFIRRLKEYKIFKAAGEELRSLHEQAALAFTRLPEELPPAGVEAELKDATAESLLLAFLSAFQERKEPEEKPVQRVRQDEFTVRQQSGMLRRRLQEKDSLTFSDLFNDGAPRMEIVVTLLAVLEMMCRGEIHISQKDVFSPIRIRAIALREDTEDTYMDEEEEPVG